MKVLQVYRTYFPETQGGLEESIRQISLSTQRLGVENRVFTLADQPADKPLDNAGITVHQCQRHFEVASCSVSLTSNSQFRKLLNWADLIHYHFPWPFADLLHLRYGRAKPTVLTYHSDIVRQRFLRLLYKPLMDRFLNSVDRIVCTSPNYFATSDTLHRFEDKVDVVPLGIDRASYPALCDTETRDVEARWGKNFFLFIGVFRYYKGLHVLLEAAKGAPFKIVIAGSGPTEKNLKRQAAAQNINNVYFPGFVSDATKVALLQACRGIVFPSFLRSEAFGVTLLEGAMFSKPLISTEVGSGTSHVNIDQETGFVVAPGSKRDLRDAMDELHENPMLAEQLGRNARKRYEQLFTGRQVGARYQTLYVDTLNERRKRDQADKKSNCSTLGGR